MKSLTERSFFSPSTVVFVSCSPSLTSKPPKPSRLRRWSVEIGFFRSTEPVAGHRQLLVDATGLHLAGGRGVDLHGLGVHDLDVAVRGVRRGGGHRGDHGGHGRDGGGAEGCVETRVHLVFSIMKSSSFVESASRVGRGLRGARGGRGAVVRRRDRPVTGRPLGTLARSDQRGGEEADGDVEQEGGRGADRGGGQLRRRGGEGELVRPAQGGGAEQRAPQRQPVHARGGDADAEQHDQADGHGAPTGGVGQQRGAHDVPDPGGHEARGEATEADERRAVRHQRDDGAERPAEKCDRLELKIQCRADDDHQDGGHSQDPPGHQCSAHACALPPRR